MFFWFISEIEDDILDSPCVLILKLNQEQKNEISAGPKRDSLPQPTTIKEVKGFELSKSIKHKYLVRVRFHPSTKTSCINDHAKPVIRNQEADHIILHTGTNDLSSDKTPVQICNDIVNLASSIKDKYIKVTISKIVERNDALNEKVVLVNEYLSKICKTIGILILKHHNIKPDFHLN